MTLKCPYCDKDNEPPDECHKEDVTYEANYSVCDTYWSGEKASCMNGGKHVWKKLTECPPDYYKHRKFCIHCGEFNNDPNVSATQ